MRRQARTLPLCYNVREPLLDELESANVFVTDKFKFDGNSMKTVVAS